MLNATSSWRALFVLVFCLPAAVFLGYTLTNTGGLGSYAFSAAFFMLLVSPILLKYHHPLLVVFWNAPISLFFLPGSPQVWLLLSLVSLTISVISKTVDRGQSGFFNIKPVTWSLIALVIVVLITCYLTGG